MEETEEAKKGQGSIFSLIIREGQSSLPGLNDSALTFGSPGSMVEEEGSLSLANIYR